MQEVPVKVAVRVRPLSPKEKLHHHQVCVKVLAGSNQLVLGKDRAFTFDYVLSAKSTQEETYKTCVEPLLQSCFEGYNATVFAYGQTGSGKTYTITGSNSMDMTEEEVGIIPRAMKQMFQMIESNHNRDTTVRISYIEIYKEELKDLLDIETSSKDLAIREDDKGNTVLTGIKEIQCDSVDDVMNCLETGSAYRHTGTTNMNEHSSRSHTVFSVIIEQRWQGNTSLAPSKAGSEEEDEDRDSDSDSSTATQFMSAKFHFVDLAGSERAHRTGNIGERFKESIHINTGLLALGNVISALGDTKKKATHIPYRDSKITRILKDSLGGNANTVMIACVSPSSVNFDESLNSLKYANRARNIKNKPIVNRDKQLIKMEEMQSEIQALREQLHRQKSAGQSDWQSEYSGEETMTKIKALEDEIVKLKNESAHYKVCTEEAFKIMVKLQDNASLRKSQSSGIQNWLDLVEETQDEIQAPSIQADQVDRSIIEKLEQDLKKARDDLASDEEIFAEKARENNQLFDKIALLEASNKESVQMLEEALERQNQQEQQLVEQQMKIAELQKYIEELESKSKEKDDEEIEARENEDVSLTTGRRAMSVPARTLRERNKSTSSDVPRPESRKVHTSPAMFSMERIVQGFRARSQLLINRLEDLDEVLQEQFSDDEVFDNDDAERSSALGKTWNKGKRLSGTMTLNKGTIDSYKGKIPRKIYGKTAATEDETPEVDKLRASTENTKQQVRQSSVRLQEAQQKMRDLTLNIKLKEGLIRELVKTSKQSEAMNKKYSSQVKQLQKESEAAKQELLEAQKTLRELESKEQQENLEKQKLQSDYRKKVDAAKMKIKALERRQSESQKMVKMQTQNEKKVSDLEHAIDKMRQQQELLQRRLKDEADRKIKLEREMQRDQQRIKELEIRNEQQQKILKRKTEEVAAAQRRLRQGSAGVVGEDHHKIEEQKKWLDSEVEKVIERKQKIQKIEEELMKREAILERKEAMLTQKSGLEMKKLRSSQVLSKDIIGLANKINTVEQEIERKSMELRQSVDGDKENVKENIKSLRKDRDRLLKQRSILDEKLHLGSLLSPSEERKLIELDEAIEAVDAAIEFKTETIQSQQAELRRSDYLSQSEDSLLNKLNTLTTAETKTLLTRYFDKVVGLRESERRKELAVSELEMKIDEQERVIHDLENALQKTAMEKDRKLTLQQKEHEQKVQLLMKQIATEPGVEMPSDLKNEVKIQQLEKDLYYYKKTSRELKKKLKELMASGLISHLSQGDGDELSSGFPSARSDNRTPRSVREDQGQGDLTPVRRSKKDLRQLSTAEIETRRSNASQSASLSDSIETSGSKNPWT
ncbi:kinesin-like protein KIF27 isoform X2 [Ptychodera flava]|uniref:kinesin-like protein KIF27 isoform X2 n=1 Tax=Ptychodera flava TaxID=63121 RepID=UPI00396A0769